MAEEIVNKIAASGLLEINLEDFYPKEEVVVFDLKPYLFMEMILKEKDFRESLQKIEWSSYQGKIVAVTCTADAIIPLWAYMLITASLQPFAADIINGDEKTALREKFLGNIRTINPAEFEDKRIVVKGCGDLSVGEYAYMEITKILKPVAKSIMYGEPCSTVPVYKKKV